MPFHLIRPWGRATYRQATVVSTHQTQQDAYAALDRIADTLGRDQAGELAGDLVVDEERRPVPRPGAQLRVEETHCRSTD